MCIHIWKKLKVQVLLSMFFNALDTCLGLKWHKLQHQWGVAWKRSACGTAEALLSLQLVCIVGSTIFLLEISHMGFRSGMLAGQSSTVISWSANNLEVVLILWAGAKVLTLDALTPASVHSLWNSLLLVHLFQPNFILPVNFAFNMLWYSTLWTAPPFSNDPLWLNVFVEGVNDRLLDHF